MMLVMMILMHMHDVYLPAASSLRPRYLFLATASGRNLPGAERLFTFANVETSNAAAKPRLPRRDVFATVTRFLRPLPRWVRRRRVTLVPEPRVPSQRYRKRMNVILATFEEPRGQGHQSTRLPMARPFNEATLPVAIPLSPASAKLVEKETADPPVDWGAYRPPVPVGTSWELYLAAAVAKSGNLPPATSCDRWPSNRPAHSSVECRPPSQ